MCVCVYGSDLINCDQGMGRKYNLHTFVVKSMSKLMANHYAQCTILEVAGGRRK